MTCGTPGTDERAEVKRIARRLDALQLEVRARDPLAVCDDWILKRLDDCIARIEALVVMNQRMRRI